MLCINLYTCLHLSPVFECAQPGLNIALSRHFSLAIYRVLGDCLFISSLPGKAWRMLVENSEYDQEIPQSQTADNPVAPQGRTAQLSRDSRKTN